MDGHVIPSVEPPRTLPLVGSGRTSERKGSDKKRFTVGPEGAAGEAEPDSARPVDTGRPVAPADPDEAGVRVDVVA